MPLIRYLTTYIASYFQARRLRKQYQYHQLNREETRQDVVHFLITENTSLQVYWKSLKAGISVAVIFCAFEYEALRFDCYLKRKGHYHLQLMECQDNCKEHVLMAESTVEEQIDRAIFELENNLYYYLQRHPDRRVRTLKVERSPLKAAIQSARTKMLQDLQKIKADGIKSDSIQLVNSQS
ncbi:hypothetical protein PJF56_15655 [Roseofilum sp. BLCC_M91]|uniref:Uncharacterized protein n=1 Tax=Roseofilum halophilum BLCC-M91 TaxID=3022259 RepID=A0ABT7BM76_9CYAN|nr:hypothetical protein [Roseofilum halophilum]MDJ1180300.1 hypothetical protein [Roseofilum halophilum BLCC-M91]